MSWAYEAFLYVYSPRFMCLILKLSVRDRAETTWRACWNSKSWSSTTLHVDIIFLLRIKGWDFLINLCLDCVSCWWILDMKWLVIDIYHWQTIVITPGSLLCSWMDGPVDIFFASFQLGNRAEQMSSLTKGLSTKKWSKGSEGGRKKLVTSHSYQASYIHLTHTIHVWYIYLHLVDFYGKCR